MRMFRTDHRPTSHQQGFTLIEVMIGLAILAIALTSGIKAIAQSAQTQRGIEQRYLAAWSANNALNEIFFNAQWPEIGSQTFNCSQLNQSYLCKKTIYATPNPIYRRVEIAVYEESKESPGTITGARLALLITLVNNPAPGLL